MNMKMPDFNVKKLVKEAGNQLSRVVQLTEEKLGTSEKTELDSHFEMLAERADSAKKWTEKILGDTESVLIPNPGNRAEDFIFEKIEKKKPTRLSNLEYMGLDMIEAGAEFGSDGPYGSALTKVGQAEQKLGQCERDFIGSSHSCFIQPLRRFLDGEMKTIIKERGILESKRLDLDSCKNRVRKARSMLGQQAAERELRVAQSDFDRQAEITKLLLENISTTQSSHLRHLHAFVEAQSRYHAHCVQVMNDLQRDLASLGGPQPYIPVGLDEKADATETVVQNNPQKRARVLCSYDAADATELNLTANEVIFVTECNPPNGDYMFGKQGLTKGLVPRAFLEVIDD
ncbi:endophilin-B1 isoform X2 [Bradysia coprophila]|uniref:endophilin-B1 isoform X2 n=1 Tax=Bradysia coprophila TaxID=38358 RepID=UPI00187DCB66|nr:endophilin-B1 isoform X2 [Bradysia coprophila]